MRSVMICSELHQMINYTSYLTKKLLRLSFLYNQVSKEHSDRMNAVVT